MQPDLKEEIRLWRAGFSVVAGVDEVGRGCFAGPIIAACVSFKSQALKDMGGVRIDDSKKLTSQKREVAAVWIKENALSWGVGKASVSEINRFGMTKATNLAFRRAIANSEIRVEYLLIDAFYIPFVKGVRRKNQKAIIKGDTKSISIASASILAKVHRDKLMVSLNELPAFRKYNWAKNKGYGTKEHREAILKYGTNKYHRKKFVETSFLKENLQATHF